MVGLWIIGALGLADATTFAAFVRIFVVTAATYDAMILGAIRLWSTHRPTHFPCDYEES
ncbi:hypothetical protein [Sulfobacillus thermosulfidooxidans]|uniref:hypothetical protein n=1 Tax=Sulfobacillus thermosulfidooxidans TaxID=28034 RepID=UPI000AAC503B|nr:hypothetical protein [Sulfobacillus thermosulfidooxidans]